MNSFKQSRIHKINSEL